MNCGICGDLIKDDNVYICKKCTLPICKNCADHYNTSYVRAGKYYSICKPCAKKEKELGPYNQ
jgi:hypothetical protein